MIVLELNIRSPPEVDIRISTMMLVYSTYFLDELFFMNLKLARQWPRTISKAEEKFWNH